MKKFIINHWGKKIRIVNQPEIINYIKNNPGMTETQIMEDVYDFRRGGFDSNKKYADCLRRALHSGKIRREFINNRYRYFIAEGPLTSDLLASSCGFNEDIDNLNSISITNMNVNKDNVLQEENRIFKYN